VELRQRVVREGEVRIFVNRPRIALAPEMAAVARGHEPGRDAHPAPLAADAPLENAGDIEPCPDLPDVEPHPADGERRGPGDHAQAGNPGQRAYDLLGEALAEVVVLL